MRRAASWRTRGLAAAGALATALAAACGGEEAGRPDLVLVTIDSLRADRLGAYGYARPTSPRIDALAAEGVVFSQAWATSSWTKPSVTSLFTSRLPSEHGAVAFDRHLDAALPTLAELLRDAGYRTAGVSGNFVHVSKRSGLARGFEHWRAVSVPAGRARGDAIFVEGEGERTIRAAAPDGARLNREVRERLSQLGEGPLFLYVHYMEPHPGFRPPARHRRGLVSDAADGAGVSSERIVDLAAGRASADAEERRRLGELYDAEIATVDEALGELLDWLAEVRPDRERVVVVVADHGEELGDRGGWFHGLTLHREVLGIPLVIWDSRGRSGPERRQEPVDLLDVTTTLLALAGVPPAPGMRGRDLLASGVPLPERPLVAELHPDPPFESHVGTREQRLAYQAWPWKAIVAAEGDPWVFRVDRDPEERARLATDASDVPPAFLASLERLRGHFLVGAPETPAEALDPQTLEGLRELGYVR